MWLAGIRDHNVPTLIGDVIFCLKEAIISSLEICKVNGKPHTWSKKVPPFQAASINYSNVFNLQYSGIFSDHGSKSSM